MNLGNWFPDQDHRFYMRFVRTHLRHIYEKLHVHSRTEAATRYLRTAEAAGNKASLPSLAWRLRPAFFERLSNFVLSEIGLNPL